MLQVKRFLVNPIAVNSYLLWDDEMLSASLIDPGFASTEEEKELACFLSENHLTLTESIATHTHFDHIWGARHIEHRYEVQTKAPSKDLLALPSFRNQLKAFGLPTNTTTEPTLTPWEAKDGDEVMLAGHSFKIITTPGHSPGHISLYSPEYSLLFCGDVLFANGYGRYDLWGASYDELMYSIHRKLFQLPAETKVLPGHGAETTIGAEKHNQGELY